MEKRGIHWIAILVLALFAGACGRNDGTTLSPMAWKVSNCQLGWEGEATGRTERQCYTEWQWRTASGLSECPGQERSGALCYPLCRAGFNGVGPICWQQCPAGYADDGATCRRNAEIIGSDNSECPWYDKCGLTFARGCSRCPDGFSNDGCTCRKDVHIFAKESYGRGAGSPMSCPPGTEQIGALCYGDCPSGYDKKGVYCSAREQTCKDVPVTQPPNLAELKPFCFARHNPDSPFVEPCTAVKTYADSEEHAREVLRCACTNCEFSLVDCATFDAGRACP
jgi:hypothetical protein